MAIQQRESIEHAMKRTDSDTSQIKSDKQTNYIATPTFIHQFKKLQTATEAGRISYNSRTTYSNKLPQYISVAQSSISITVKKTTSSKCGKHG